ncbi:hypothetical protein [Alkalihalophilus marmarensis]|uniref:hypothetical protein n=1 Tax=Alkalihalophilus marmarensis TaxID=521377 RepID=UPI002DB5B7F4|nr:hypothetical protein [Alkalihalophilus marmarensis]MEC2072207.1 hypothetical protein [Alkalihalophilus marmarensis]
MTKDKNRNLKVLGEGRYPGGDYEKIKFTGKGEIYEDLRSKETKVIGECHINGNATMEQVHVTGDLIIDERLSSNELKIVGKLQVKKSIKANKLDMRGFLTGAENVELEVMKLEGGFNISGLLNVGDLQVNLLVAPSKVCEIGSEKITVKSRSYMKRSYTLEAEVIEGDTIYLEHTTAKIVRGNDIEIGPNCHIEKIEYRSTFKNKEKDSKNILQVNQI